MEVQSLVGPRIVLNAVEEKKSFIPAENRNPAVQHVDDSCADWAIPAHMDKINNDRGNDEFITSVS